MRNSKLIKFTDDMTVIGLIIDDDESVCSNEIELPVKWSNDNIPILNVDKTKEFIVDIRQSKNLKDSIIINGCAVEHVNINKSLGLTVINTLLLQRWY